MAIRTLIDRYMIFYDSTYDFDQKTKSHLHLFDLMKPWKMPQLPPSDINVMVLPFTSEKDRGLRTRIEFRFFLFLPPLCVVVVHLSFSPLSLSSSLVSMMVSCVWQRSALQKRDHARTFLRGVTLILFECWCTLL